jgi:hypothetical protein
LRPSPSWSVLDQDGYLEAVVAEAQVLHVEPHELGPAAAAREPEAEQGAVSDVARVVSSHRFDEGAQRVDEHRVLLGRCNADRASDALEDLGDLSGHPRGREAVELVRLTDGDQGPLDGGDLPVGDRQRRQVQRDRARQGGHRGEPLRLAPGREHDEIVGVRSLGVLGAGCPGVGRSGISELGGRRGEVGAASARRLLRRAAGESGGLLRGFRHGG